MEFIHVKFFKYVPTGESLDNATQIKILNEEVGLEGDPVIIERICSSHPAAEDRIEIGEKFLVRLSMFNGSLTDVAASHGGTHVAGVYTKQPGIRALSDYDIRLEMIRRADGVLVPLDLTHMNFTGKRDWKMKQGEHLYLPVQLESTSDTVMTVDNSVS
jgi:hypothetical protein